MEKQLTEKNIAVLLWLKALHDFKEEDFANSTFQEKLNAFESVEDIGISREEFEEEIEFWTNLNVFEKDENTEELFVSSQGQKLFELLDAKGEGEVEKFLKNVNIQLKIEEIVKWVKEHKTEIYQVVKESLSFASIVLKLFN